MICNAIGLTADSFESIYVTGGAEIAEIYGGLNYSDLIFLKSQSMTGDTPLMYDSYPGRLTDYTILGNSYQDGVPDPDHPVEVVSVGEKTENLFDKSKVEQDCYYDADGVKCGSKYHNESDYIPVKAGKTYTFYLRTLTFGFGTFINLYDASREFYVNVCTLRNPDGYYEFTPDVDGYIRFNETPQYATDYMLYEGSQGKPYEPYGYKIPVTVFDGTNSQTYPIYLSEPLRRIGDYADEIDFKAGTVTRNNDVIDILSDTSKISFVDIYHGTYACFRYRIVTGQRNGSSNIFKMKNVYFDMMDGPGFVTFLYCTSLGIHFSVPPSINTVEKCIQWLTDIYTATGKRPVFVFPIATPTIEQVTVPAIPTINGQNTLSIGTTLQPSQLSITGHIKPSSSYGNLTDVRAVYIKDKDGVQIKVTG